MVKNSIGIAVGLGFALALGSAATAGDEHQYVGVKKCTTCHKKELIGNQVAKWKESKHSKAFEGLASQKAIEYARAAGIQGSPQEADECVKCHVTAHGVAPSLLKYPLKAEDGVQCESCHGPGSDYRKKKIMSDRELAVSKGLTDKPETVCVNCHNEESPAWDPKRYAVDGGHTGFDFEQAKAKIEHPIPANVKGKYIEMEKKLRAEKRSSGGSDEDED